MLVGEENLIDLLLWKLGAIDHKAANVREHEATPIVLRKGTWRDVDWKEVDILRSAELLNVISGLVPKMVLK